MFAKFKRTLSDHADVPELVAELLDFVAVNQTTLDVLILAGLFHKQLVIIHPFMDGNGRTTRLATKLLLAGLGVDTFNLFSFENYYSQNVSRYFQQVGVFGNYYEIADDLDFTPWLEYFADGILDELRRVEKQLERHVATPDNSLQPYHRLILDTVDNRGFITDKIYERGRWILTGLSNGAILCARDGGGVLIIGGLIDPLHEQGFGIGSIQRIDLRHPVKMRLTGQQGRGSVTIRGRGGEAA